MEDVQARTNNQQIPEGGPERPTIRASILRGALTQLKLDAPTGYARVSSDISPEFLNPKAEALVSVDAYLESFGRLRRAAVTPGFTFRAGLAQDFAELGLFGWSLVTSETLWDGLKLASEASKYEQSYGSVQLGLKKGRFRLEYDHGFGPIAEAEADAQHSIALAINLIRQTEGYKDANLVVRFPGCTSCHSDLLSDALEVTGSSRAFIEFDEFLLRHPLKRSNAGLSSTISSVMSILKHAEHDIAQIVRALQVAAIHEIHTPLTLRTVSALLRVGERRLQFELQQCGDSFADVRNRVRHEAAKADLRSGRSIAETARRLGYGHQQTFSNAFHRWEGIAPSVYASRGE